MSTFGRFGNLKSADNFLSARSSTVIFVSCALVSMSFPLSPAAWNSVLLLGASASSIQYSAMEFSGVVLVDWQHPTIADDDVDGLSSFGLTDIFRRSIRCCVLMLLLFFFLFFFFASLRLSLITCFETVQTEKFTVSLWKYALCVRASLCFASFCCYE